MSRVPRTTTAQTAPEPAYVNEILCAIVLTALANAPSDGRALSVTLHVGWTNGVPGALKGATARTMHSVAASRESVSADRGGRDPDVSYGATKGTSVGTVPRGALARTELRVTSATESAPAPQGLWVQGVTHPVQVVVMECSVPSSVSADMTAFVLPWMARVTVHRDGLVIFVMNLVQLADGGKTVLTHACVRMVAPVKDFQVGSVNSNKSIPPFQQVIDELRSFYS